MSHDQPSYANLPGIRVFGMKCVSTEPQPLPQRKKPVVHHRLPVVSPRPTIHKVVTGGAENSGQYQYQQNYQYLSRPDSYSGSSSSNSHYNHVGGGASSTGGLQHVSVNNGYGRSEEGSATESVRRLSDDDKEVEEQSAEEEANEATADNKQQPRQEKSLQYTNSASDYDDEPEFPWHKVQELQNMLQWHNN